MRKSSRAGGTDSDGDDFKPPAVPGRSSRKMMPASTMETRSGRQHFPERVPDSSVARAHPTVSEPSSSYGHDRDANKKAGMVPSGVATSSFHPSQAQNTSLGDSYPGKERTEFNTTASPSAVSSEKYQYAEEEQSEIPYKHVAASTDMVHPGAVPVHGPGHGGPTQYASMWDMNPTTQPPPQDNVRDQEQHLALAAEVVPEEADVEARVDQRVRQQTDQIAAQVRQTLIHEAAHADVVDEEGKDSLCNRHKKWLIVGAIAVVLIGLIVALVVLLLPKNGGNDKATPMPTPVQVEPTPSPMEPSPSPMENTEGPTMSPSGAASELDSLRELLVPVVGDVFTDPSSPQYAALDWLANDDPANLTVASTPLTTLKNRFIFATLYFSTSGASWVNQYNFLSEADICDWNDGGTQEQGIVCGSSDSDFEVDLGENGLAGPLPEEIMLLNELVSLAVDDNVITGTIPGSTGAFSNLEEIELSGNSLSGTLPSQIFELPKLEYFSVFGNEQINGTIPQNVGNAVSLKHLIISGNSITGTIPSSVGELQFLETLFIVFNSLSGSIPNLEKCQRLSAILLENNILSGSIPSSIGNLPRLGRFMASKNALTGKIPSFAGNSGSLNELWLHDNLLTSIGDFFGTSVSSLKVVQGYNNLFEDTLPSQIGQFSNLRVVDLTGNLMVGSIPTEVGLLPIQAYDNSIKTFEGMFDVRNNRMTGTIPSEIGQCINMNILDVSFNQLQGSVPTEIAALPLLDKLYVMGNEGITGDLDPLFCSRPTPFTALQSDCLRDDVTCSCCDRCCSSSDPLSCKNAPF